MKILMISNHLACKAGCSAMCRTFCSIWTLPATGWICLSAFARQIKLRARGAGSSRGAYHCGAGQ